MRSIWAGPPETVVACPIGHGLVGQAQRGGGEQQRRRIRIAAAHQDVDDDWRRMDALVEGVAAGGLDVSQPVNSDADENPHHLPVALASQVISGSNQIVSKPRRLSASS